MSWSSPSPSLALGLTLALLGCAPERDCTTELWWVGAADEVAVVGDFNGWNPESTPLEEVADDAWSTTVELGAGDYAYLMWVDGEEQADPFAPLVQWDPVREAEVSLLRVDDCAQPAWQLDEAEATADGLSVEASFLRGAARLDRGSVSAHLPDGSPLDLTVRGCTAVVECTEFEPGKYTVVLSGADRDGREAVLRVPLWVEASPWAWEDAVVYQVVVDRFAAVEADHDPADIGSRMGGDLAGLTEVIRTGYFEDLGVSALWISPLYDNAEGAWPGFDDHVYEAYHQYWPVAPRAVEPALGTEADVEALVAEAHARGIRVLMDLVPNHVHLDHPYWAEHAADGWFHEEPDCVCGNYTCPWHDAIETCWFTDYLPDLAWENPEVARTVSADSSWWATRFDLDGFRVDAVPMLPRSAVRELVWTLARDLEQGPTRFYTVGETYTTRTGAIRVNLGPHGLDGQFEFPVMWAVRDLLAWESGSGADLEDAIAESEQAWVGSGSVMAPFLGNHDVSRFISEAAFHETHRPWEAPPGAPEAEVPYHKLVAAHAVVLSLPGAPVIYYGDELGLPGGTDPDCRRPMRFGDDLSELQAWTLARVQRLGRARACSVALRRGERLPLVADGTTWAQVRDAGDGQPAITAVNASGWDRTVTLDIPGELALEPGTTFTDVIEGAAGPTLTPGSTATVELPAWSARLWLPSASSCTSDGGDS